MINLVIDFLFEKTPHVSLLKKLFLIIKFYYISFAVDCAHNNFEMLTMARSIFKLPSNINGDIIEAGSYKGGGTAKLSLIAKIVNRRLIVFDSFYGIPENNEIHSYGKYKKRSFVFTKGAYKGTLSEVKKNVEKYGAPDVCIYKKGLFEETMPKFHGKAAFIFLDVDLASSTRTCLKYLYPLLSPNGVLYSHDGHLTLVTHIFENKTFWKKEVGFLQPKIEGLDKQKLLKIVKVI